MENETQVQEALSRLLAGKTVIVIAHRMRTVLSADKIVVLRDGRVEQIGSPMDLYNDPANQFVAGFLGAPSMNFLPAARIGRDGGRTFGIRPEHLVIDPSGPLAGQVVHVEKLGGDTNAIVDLGEGAAVTLRLFGQHPIAANDRVRLGFDPARAYYFEAAGRRARAA